MAADRAHPVVKSMTLKGDAADKYVGIDSFLVDIVFEAASETNKITAPTAENVALTYDPSGRLGTIEMLRKSDALYEARIRSTTNAQPGAVTISVTADLTSSIRRLILKLVAPLPNPAKATVTVDRAMPIFTVGCCKRCSDAR